MIAWLQCFVMEVKATVGQYLITPIINFVKAMAAERERGDVTQIQNVKGHLSVELIIVLLDSLGWDAAQNNVMITLTAQVENVRMRAINVFWTLILLTGPSAAKIHCVLMGKEIVITTLIVREDYSVEKTIVQTGKQEWTAVKHTLVIEVFYDFR